MERAVSGDNEWRLLVVHSLPGISVEFLHNEDFRTIPSVFIGRSVMHAECEGEKRVSSRPPQTPISREEVVVRFRTTRRERHLSSILPKSNVSFHCRISGALSAAAVAQGMSYLLFSHETIAMAGIIVNLVLGTD